MLTFFHAPNSRSSAIATLIDEMGISDWIETRLVSIPRQDGSGGRDPMNPHPEGKVPVLVHDGQVITERGPSFCTSHPCFRTVVLHQRLERPSGVPLSGG